MLLTLRNPPPTLQDVPTRFTKVFKEVVDSCLQKEPQKRFELLKKRKKNEKTKKKKKCS